MSDQQIEQEIQAKGLTAPRVTPQRIEDVIVSEHYFTASQGMAGVVDDGMVDRFLTWPVPASAYPDGTPGKEGRTGTNLLSCIEARQMLDHVVAAPVPASLALLTFCVLVLENGFTVTGESACASPENFDAEIGRKIARDNAINKVWMLEGYLLKQQLHEQGRSIQPSHIDRMRQERVELCERLNKLGNFIATEKFTSLSANEQSRMKRQLVAMREYAEVLGERLQYAAVGNQKVLTDADALADLNGTPRPDNPSVAS